MHHWIKTVLIKPPVSKACKLYNNIDTYCQGSKCFTSVMILKELQNKENENHVSLGFQFEMDSASLKFSVT